MPRSDKDKVQHDREVRKIAKEYLGKGYKVEADLPGWEQPEIIKGVRPDIRAWKKGHETLVEVETPESVDCKRDEQQNKTFKKWSNGSQHKHFKRIVTEE